jgi:hypothetical protein
LKGLLRNFALGAAATMLVAAAFASDGETRTLLSASGMKIELPWSKRWAQRQDPQYQPQTVGFGIDGDPQAMHVMISAGAPVAADGMTDARMRDVMQGTIDVLAPQAVEQDLAPLRLEGGRHRGFYVTATDKAPKPDEYKYISQVLVAAGDAFVLATILYNDSASEDARQVRDALGNITVTLPQ